MVNNLYKALQLTELFSLYSQVSDMLIAVLLKFAILHAEHRCKIAVNGRLEKTSSWQKRGNSSIFAEPELTAISKKETPLGYIIQ